MPCSEWMAYRQVATDCHDNCQPRTRLNEHVHEPIAVRNVDQRKALRRVGEAIVLHQAIRKQRETEEKIGHRQRCQSNMFSAPVPSQAIIKRLRVNINNVRILPSNP